MMFRQLSIGSRTFQKGETILRQGDPVDYLWLLESGTCYRYMLTDKGDTITYEIRGPEDSVRSLIGVLSLYHKGEPANFTFVARTACTCLCIPADAFLLWAADKPGVLNDLVCFAMDCYTELRLSFQAYQEGRLANRLCNILLSCSKPMGDDLVITKKYTFAEMASMLGVHPVTVSRIVRALCEEQVLSKKTDGLHITDTEQFLRYAHSGETINYK